MKDGRDPDTGRFLAGNPGGPGRPKGSQSLTAILREVMEETTATGQTVAEVFVRACLTHAAQGNAALVKEIWQRLEGKAPDAPKTDDGGHKPRINPRGRARPRPRPTDRPTPDRGDGGGDPAE